MSTDAGGLGTIELRIEGAGLIREGELRVLGQRREDQYILMIAGQIDMATVGQFEAALAQAGAAPDQVVVVDLSEVDFIDSTGISALMQAETTARPDPDRIQFLRRFHPEVEAVLRMSGVYGELQFIEPDEVDS